MEEEISLQHYLHYSPNSPTDNDPGRQPTYATPERQNVMPAGLSCLGKTDYDAFEQFRKVPFLHYSVAFGSVSFFDNFKDAKKGVMQDLVIEENNS